MKKKSKVTIVIAIYNLEKVVGECIDSVLRQSYKNLECLLVNDCSNDDTKKILENFAQNDKRIVLVNHSENLGLARTRRSGLEKASGEYIWQIDGDDILEDFAIQSLVHMMEKDKCDIARTGYTLFTGSERKSSGTENRVVSSNNSLEFYGELCTAPMGMVFNMFRASFVSKIGIPDHRGIDLGEDFVFNSYMYSKTNKISLSNISAYNYRREGGSYTTGELRNRKFIDESLAHRIVYENWAEFPLARGIFLLKMIPFRVEKIRQVVRLKNKNYALEVINNYKFIYNEVPIKLIYRDVSKIVDMERFSPKNNRLAFDIVEMLISLPCDDVYSYLKSNRG